MSLFLLLDAAVFGGPLRPDVTRGVDPLTRLYGEGFSRDRRRLGISKTAAEIAVRELVDLGLMKETKNGFGKTNRKVRLSAGRSLPEIRRFHAMTMTRAGITVTASPQKIDWAKTLLSEGLHEMANALTEDAGTEVYQLAAPLFPLTTA